MWCIFGLSRIVNAYRHDYVYTPMERYLNRGLWCVICESNGSRRRMEAAICRKNSCSSGIPDDPLKGCHVETKTSTRIPPITVVGSISCCISIIFYSYGEKDRTVADVVVLDYYLHRRRRLWDA